MGRGRPKDHAPEGYYTTSEAAAILGVSAARIRQRVAEGSLPTAAPDVTGSLEARHYIPKEVVDKEAAEKSLPADRHQVETSTDAVMGKVDDMISKFEDMALAARGQRDAIEDAVKAQDEHITERLAAVERNQEAQISNLKAAIEVMREAARRESIYQDRMMEMLDREAERQAERERRGLPERRSLWRRLFGS